jgi:hypothetical protein
VNATAAIGGAGAAGAAGNVDATFGLDATVLASGARGDGRHFVLRAQIGGRDLVVKLYGRKRSALRDLLRDLGQRLFVGKSGVGARRRAATERAVLSLWRREGFDVPALVDGVVLPAAIRQPRVVMEYVPGRMLDGWIADPAPPLAEKVRVVARLAQELARRHARALALREPMLIQVHAALGHVLYVAAENRPAGPAVAERLVTFDFEVAWTRRHGFEAMLRQEFSHYLEDLERSAPAPQRAALVAAFHAKV